MSSEMRPQNFGVYVYIDDLGGTVYEVRLATADFFVILDCNLSQYVGRLIMSRFGLSEIRAVVPLPRSCTAGWIRAGWVRLT